MSTKVKYDQSFLDQLKSSIAPGRQNLEAMFNIEIAKRQELLEMAEDLNSLKILQGEARALRYLQTLLIKDKV